jgi:hypothetical protein
LPSAIDRRVFGSGATGEVTLRLLLSVSRPLARRLCSVHARVA